MASRTGRLFRKLRSNNSGNAVMLVALGMPALVGGAGLAVDTAQWYLWKRELQSAADQAALAGAWAETNSATSSTYQSRATQEFTANLQTTKKFSSTPSVSLAKWNGATSNNSVVVTATATKKLPFSAMLTGRSVTIRVSSQASFNQGGTYTSCLLATSPTDSGSITLGGNATVTAQCGIASLSTSSTSIVMNGNPTIEAGSIYSMGGIDAGLAADGNALHPYMTGLVNPFASLTPPTNTTAQSYGCTPGGTTTTASVTTTVNTSYSYYKGASQNNATATTYSPAKSSTTVGPTTQNNVTVANGTTAGTSNSSSSTWTSISGSGKNTIWEVKTTTTTTTYSNVVATTSPTQASLQPGTYSSISTSCNTVFSPGIYVINGGAFKITAQYQVTGSGVMFVLKNGAYFDFTGGAQVNLTAMTSSQLQTAGVSATNAQSLAGMLIFEDPNSSGSNKDTLNGNASTYLNGTIYLPKSNLKIDGTFSVTSQCLMIAANDITIQGTANLSTFCPSGMQETTNIGSSTGSVKLVS